MSKVKSILFFLIVSLSLFNCQEEENASSIITLDPEVVSNTTIKLKALLKAGDCDEYGFVWDGLPDPDYSKNKIVFHDPLPNKEITANLNNLDLEETYYVRAYTKKGNDIQYGKEKSFVFGGLTPEIIKLLPDRAHLSDTILIIGKNFSSISERVVIQFESLLSTIVYASSDTLQCIVPGNLAAGSHSVKVKVGNQTSSTSPSFTLLHPEIVTVTPMSGTFLDLLVIEGNNFNPKPSSNKVWFGTALAEVVQASSVSLTVKVPVELSESSTTISVQVDSQRVKAMDEFTLLPMSISSIEPMSERIGGVVTISGVHFNPSKNHNAVLFDGNSAVVLEASATQLRVRVPNGIFADRSVTIQVKVGGMLEDISFTIDNAWIRRADIPAGIFGRWGGQGFAINGVGYAGLGGNAGVSTAYQDFYRFDDITNSWTRIADFGGGKRYWTASFVIDDIAYVGTGSVTTMGEGTNEFYKYDAQSNTWTRIADFPGSPTTRAVGFSLNGKGYLVLRTEADNFWEYDPPLNTWTKKSTLITSPWGGSKIAVGAFVLNNRAFVVTSRYSRGEVYEYDYNNDSWIRKNDLADIGNLPAVVSTSNHAYYIEGYQAREYDLDNDTWRYVDFEPVPTRNDAFFFGVGEKIFIGGGRENSYKDFWECDTSKL